MIKNTKNLPKSMGASQVSQAQILRSNSLKKAIQIMEENDKKTFGARTMKSAAMKEKASARVMKGVSAAVEKNNGVLILDGGTITGMKELTKDLYKEYRLWQLYFLKNNPGLIQKCHEKYYESGANIIMTATYNARVKTSFFLNKAVDLAVEAKKKAMKKEPLKDHLIAAAQGCYGSAATASLEYDGSYGSEMSVKYLEQQHSQKFNELVDNKDVDIIAFETIPCLKEVKAILNLIKTRPGAKVWIAVSCKSATELNSGDSFAEFVDLVEKQDKAGQVEALGVNCSQPKFMTEMIKTIRSKSSRTIICYPNNGGVYDAFATKWIDDDGSIGTPESFAKEAVNWTKHGAPIIIGGCCRTHFDWVKQLKKHLVDKDAVKNGGKKGSETKSKAKMVGKKRSLSGKTGAEGKRSEPKLKRAAK